MYQLRPATEEDFEFLVELDVAAMRAYVEATWGFCYERQRAYIRSSFVPHESQIILVEGEAAGYLYAVQGPEGLHVVDIKLLPRAQGRGIGGAILRELVRQAEARGLPTRLSVLKVNPARRLYERLGFRVVGGNEWDFWMRREPGQAQPPSSS